MATPNIFPTIKQAKDQWLDPASKLYQANTGYLRPNETYEQYMARQPKPQATKPLIDKPAFDMQGNKIDYNATAPSSNVDYNSLLQPLTFEQRMAQEKKYQEGLLGSYQPQIDAVRATYAETYRQAREQAKAREARSLALSSSAGLAGTPMGEAKRQQAEEQSMAVERAISAEENAKIAQIFGEVQKRSSEMYQADRAEAIGLAEKAQALREKAMTSAKQNLFDLAKTGYKWDAKAQQLAEQAGIDSELAEVLYMANSPAEAKIEWKTQALGDGKTLFWGIDPKTNQPVTKTVDSNVPQGYKMTMFNGQPYYVPEGNAEGDVSGAIKYESESDKKFRQEKELATLKSSLNIGELREKAKIEGKSVQEADSAAKAELLNLVNTLYNDPKLPKVFGVAVQASPEYYVPANQITKNQVNQLIASLSLENRQKLKGSGAISDFEAQTLSKAATSLNTNLDPTSAKKEIAKIRGVMQTANGGTAEASIRNPQTGETQKGQVTRETINQAIKDGMIVEYQ